MAGLCYAIGCRASILRTEVFCAKHLVMLETDTRALIGQTFRARKRQSATFEVHLARARQEILFYQTNGHRMPKASAFDWDDVEFPCG